MIKNSGRFAGGLLLLIFCAGLFFYGVRVSLAQSLYNQAKFSLPEMNVKAVLRRCESAHRLYPHNYYFTLYAAERSYHAAETDNDIRNELLFSAEKWCETAFQQNPYRSSINLLKARLLARDSIHTAIDFWHDYVEWHFWEPYNHLVQIELYLQAGMLEEAMDALPWVKGSRYEKEAQQLIDEAWQREQDYPLHLISPRDALLELPSSSID